MKSSSRPILVVAAAAAALAFGPAAQAGGHPKSEVVHFRTKLAAAPSSPVRVARLEVDRHDLQHQSIRLELAGVPPGSGPEVFIADSTGALVDIAPMHVRGRSGRASWFVRTARGDALPFGVPDVAFLSGRAIEVHSSTGEVLVTGVLPTASKATGISRNMKSLKLGLAVDPSLPGVDAHIVFRRGEDGGPDRFLVRVDGAAAGLSLEAWLIGTDGTAVKLGDLTAVQSEGDQGDQGENENSGDGSSTGGSSGSSSDDSNDSTDDAVVTPTAEYMFELDANTTLPFGATSLAGLAGLTLQVRNAADGSVVASGILPDTSAPGDEGDDDNQGDEGNDTSSGTGSGQDD
jgi:hypothetical protein